MIRSIKTVAVLGVASAAIVASTQAAQASSCTDATYGNSGTYSTYYDACQANNTANQSSVVATSTAVLAAAVTQSSGMVADRVSSALGGTGGFNVAENGFSASTGAAAGNMGGKVGAWVSGSWSDVEDESASTSFDGNVYNGMVGVDFKVTPRAVLGVSVGYEDVDLDTDYNRNLVTGEQGNVSGDGYTVAPYIGVKLGENAQGTLVVGYSDIEYDSLRFDPISAARITGSTDAERYFVNASVGGSHMLTDKWRLAGLGSVFYASEDKDGYTETSSDGSTIAVADTDNDLGQVGLDARLGYMFGAVEPYALAGVEFDFSKDDAPVAAGQTTSLDDDFGAKFGAGLNLNLGPNVTGGIEAYTVEFRDDYNEYTVTGGLRVQF